MLCAIAAALTPEGTFLMVDFAASSKLDDNVDHPLGPSLYMFSVLHCMTVSLAQDGAGPRHGLGRAGGSRDARCCRFRQSRREANRRRPVQQLLRRSASHAMTEENAGAVNEAILGFLARHASQEVGW